MRLQLEISIQSGHLPCLPFGLSNDLYVQWVEDSGRASEGVWSVEKSKLSRRLHDSKWMRSVVAGLVIIRMSGRIDQNLFIIANFGLII